MTTCISDLAHCECKLLCVRVRQLVLVVTLRCGRVLRVSFVVSVVSTTLQTRIYNCSCWWECGTHLLSLCSPSCVKDIWHMKNSKSSNMLLFWMYIHAIHSFNLKSNLVLLCLGSIHFTSLPCAVLLFPFCLIWAANHGRCHIQRWVIHMRDAAWKHRVDSMR